MFYYQCLILVKISPKDKLTQNLWNNLEKREK